MTGPPDPPWMSLHDAGTGHLAVYYSDRIGRYPVRDITRRSDNKADPNIETATFGLFSTCEPRLRNRVVQDGAATLFFLTTPVPGRGRVLAGYYHVRWYAEGSHGAANRDYALAADQCRFIDPIPVTSLPVSVRERCAGAFRQHRRLCAEEVAILRDVCDDRRDRTGDYVREVRRIERFARERTGLAYPSQGRVHGFSWPDAPGFLYDGESAASYRTPTTSPSGVWRCAACNYKIRSSALLKQCPLCHEVRSLRPEVST